MSAESRTSRASSLVSAAGNEQAASWTLNDWNALLNAKLSNFLRSPHEKSSTILFLESVCARPSPGWLSCWIGHKSIRSLFPLLSHFLVSVLRPPIHLSDICNFHPIPTHLQPCLLCIGCQWILCARTASVVVGTGQLLPHRRMGAFRVGSKGCFCTLTFFNEANPCLSCWSTWIPRQRSDMSLFVGPAYFKSAVNYTTDFPLKLMGSGMRLGFEVESTANSVVWTHPSGMFTGRIFSSRKSNAETTWIWSI